MVKKKRKEKRRRNQDERGRLKDKDEQDVPEFTTRVLMDNNSIRCTENISISHMYANSPWQSCWLEVATLSWTCFVAARSS